MAIKKIFLFSIFSILSVIFLFLILIFFTHQKKPSTVSDTTEFNKYTDTRLPIPTPEPTTPIPTAYEHNIAFVNFPKATTEGDNLTFTWLVNGPSATIHTTTVYYGLVSMPDILTTAASPSDTHYTQALPDFMEGDFDIPLQFISNTKSSFPGKYFFRGYANIDGKNYWTQEYSFSVDKRPRNEISIADRPVKVAHGINTSFTWDIVGPEAKFAYTAIVAAKESKAGPLDENTPLEKTPYKVIVKDFSDGSYTAPFRFVGNAVLNDTGVYYYRGLAFINGKNIWSEEYSFTVE